MADLTRGSGLYGYDEFARSQGLVPEALLRGAGLPEDCLAYPELYFSYRKFVHLMELSAAASGNPFFGCELGSLQGIHVFGPIAYLIRNCSTVGEAIENLIRYYHLHSAGARLDLESKGKTAFFSYSLTISVPEGARQAIDLACAVGVQVMRTLVPGQYRPREILVQHSPGPTPSRYRRSLGLVPRFNAESNGLVFDSRLLGLPLADADPALHALMQRQLEALDAEFRDELPGQVESLIRSLLPAGEVSVASLASHMAMSSRTLQRYLMEEGTSFQRLLDKSRRDVARQYLRDSSLQLTEISVLLGYTDLSAFSRAFARWFGMSASRWRKEQVGSRKRLRVRATH